MTLDANKDNRAATIDTTTNYSVDVSTDAEKGVDKAISQAKEEVDTFRGTTIDNRIQSAASRSDIVIAHTEFMDNLRLDSLDGYLHACDELLKEIDDAIDATRNPTIGLSQAGRKTMQNTRRNLQGYKKTVKGKKNALMRQRNPQIYESDKQNLKAYRRNVQIAKQDIAQGQWGELSHQAGYLYNSPEVARQSNIQQERIQQFEQKLQQEVQDGAILNILGNTYNATNFYRRIAEGQYTSADYTTYTTYADIFDDSFQRCGISRPTQQGVTGFSSIDKRTQTYPDYSNTGRQETFKQGGIGGCIDKLLSNCNNLTPGQRNTWKTLGVLAGFGGAIFGLYKFYKSKKMNFWGKAGITAGAILGTQILTGENPLSLFTKFMTGGLSRDKITNSFGNAISGISGSGIESSETITPAMYSLMVFNSGTTVGKINEFTQSFKADNNERKAFYNQSLNILENQYGGAKTAQYFRATFSENFDEEKWNNRLASFGVVDISNPLNKDKLIYELANNATMNEIALDRFKSENGLKETDDKNKKQEFKQYISGLKNKNEPIDMATLERHKLDWFQPDVKATFTEREEDRVKRDLLEGQVESLPLNQSKKEELKTAIKLFYDKRTIESKPNPPSNFSLEFSNGILTIISHEGYKTQVDLEKRQIEGFEGHTFATLDELINAADITNKILLSQKGKVPIKLPAFEYKPLIGGIYFNDAETISKNFDTRVLSNWRRNGARKLNQIYKYPNEYAAYLSERRKENKIEIDSMYPLVKELSEKGIVFTNENEIRELESRLNQIKEGKKFAIGDIDGKPFKISWRFKEFGNRLVFTAINGKKEVFTEDISEKFPTIMAYKDEFLKYINDENNKMRGSRIK